MFKDKTKVALRDLIEQVGTQTPKVIATSLREGKVRPEDFSIREIWEACEPGRSVTEAVSSDMFPQITGELINAKVIAGYNSIDAVGDMLCTTVPSRMEVDTIAGFNAVEMPEEVQQGRPYNESDMGEKYVTNRNKKFGRLISVTEEAIYFDKTGQILAMANRIGIKAKQHREKLIVEGVQDINSTVFNVSGTAVAFYRTAASGIRRINSRSATPFGEAGLEQALKLVHNMTDENGDYVGIPQGNLVGLFPFDVYRAALQMVRSPNVPESGENAVNIYKALFTPITSPYVTAQSTSTWYLGDFKMAFWWMEVWPLQVFSAAPGHEQDFERDIKSRHKVRYFGNITGVDDKYGFKFTG